MIPPFAPVPASTLHFSKLMSKMLPRLQPFGPHSHDTPLASWLLGSPSDSDGGRQLAGTVPRMMHKPVTANMGHGNPCGFSQITEPRSWRTDGAANSQCPALPRRSGLAPGFGRQRARLIAVDSCRPASTPAARVDRGVPAAPARVFTPRPWK